MHWPRTCGARAPQVVLTKQPWQLLRRSHCQCTANGLSTATTLSTPQPPHVPVLLSEVLQLFKPVSLKTFVDGTLGAGGHAAAVCEEHPELALLVGIDLDQSAHRIARQRLEPMLQQRSTSFEAVHGNFRHLATHIASVLGGGEDVCDGLLLDLGVSSMQLDTVERGFSFLRDAPLDMRMDAGGDAQGPGAGGWGVTAELAVNTWSEAQLGRVIRDYGEERYWRQVARRIVEAREHSVISTTHQLVQAIGRLPGGRSKSGAKAIHPATRTFQAIRIAVNDELGSIEAALPAAMRALRPGGRLAVISFHSLEDRLVKTAMRRAAGMSTGDEHVPVRYLPDPADQPPTLVKLVTKRPLGPGDDEVAANPRARSAKLRCVERL